MGIYFRYPKEEALKREGRELVYECEKRPLTSEETLANIISYCKNALDEIEESRKEGNELTAYAEGIKSGYVEILQIIQEWEKKKEYGLDIDIEAAYPVC